MVGWLVERQLTGIASIVLVIGVLAVLGAAGASSTLLIAAVIVWIIPIFVARAQGRAKNREGWAYGLLLGWIGVLVLALLPALPDTSKYGECPWCREDLRLDASVCPHCRRDVTPLIDA
jgi:hypothetical protein